MEATQMNEATQTHTALPAASVEPDPEWVDRVRERLLRDAFLFDDPRVYRAGVEDTLAQVAASLRER